MALRFCTPREASDRPPPASWASLCSYRGERSCIVCARCLKVSCPTVAAVAPPIDCLAAVVMLAIVCGLKPWGLVAMRFSVGVRMLVGTGGTIPEGSRQALRRSRIFPAAAAVSLAKADPLKFFRKTSPAGLHPTEHILQSSSKRLRHLWWHPAMRIRKSLRANSFPCIAR